MLKLCFLLQLLQALLLSVRMHVWKPQALWRVSSWPQQLVPRTWSASNTKLMHAHLRNMYMYFQETSMVEMLLYFMNLLECVCEWCCFLFSGVRVERERFNSKETEKERETHIICKHEVVVLAGFLAIIPYMGYKAQHFAYNSNKVRSRSESKCKLCKGQQRLYALTCRNMIDFFVCGLHVSTLFSPSQ